MPAHLLVVPIVLPLIAGALLLVLERWRPGWQTPVGVAATLLLALAACALAIAADRGEIAVYLLGNWRAPYGIVLVLDRLAALMLVLTSALAFGCALAATGPFSARGPHYAAFFQFQLAGLNGAFLTGDVFNLFVFFEVLLIASYALLLSGAGSRALRVGFQYIVINLVGSTLFLVAASLLYGVVGTLNLADLALRLRDLAGEDLALAHAGLLLLLTVFALKAALLPFGFWLPATYAGAPAPVAALFAIMTKVGVYAILRVCTTVWGEGGDSAFFAGPVTTLLVVAGVATVVHGASGALAADSLRTVIACLVAMSSGSLIAVAAANPAESAGALYYLVHSTLVGGALFLLAGPIARQRGDIGDQLRAGPRIEDPALLGAGFFVAAVAVAGMPPLSGFIGKVQMLESVRATEHAAAVWAMLLASGLVTTIALSRAGSRVFWKSTVKPAPTGGAMSHGERAGLFWILGLLALLAVAAAPAARFAAGAAAELAQPRAYIDAVMDADPIPPPARALKR